MMDYKKFLKKTSVVLSAILLALQIGMQSASAFTVAESATSTNGVSVNVKQIKELATLPFDDTPSTPSQALAQTLATLVSHDVTGPDGAFTLKLSAQDVLKYFYPSYTADQLQGATITPAQAVTWLHSIGYTGTIIDRPLTTAEIKTNLDQSKPMIAVLANQNSADWINQNYATVIYAHDDVDAGTQHLHKSFLKSTTYGEAQIQDGQEAVPFSFPDATTAPDPTAQQDAFKWVSTITDIHQDPAWTNTKTIAANKQTGVFASKLTAAGTQSELDFTDATIATQLYGKYPDTSTDQTTKLAAISLI
ncbi:MAG: transglutaminase, partial [Streptococcaceae bacterium]|nr:transglutaminase [Streptococcaceae bacterium]